MQAGRLAEAAGGGMSMVPRTTWIATTQGEPFGEQAARRKPVPCVPKGPLDHTDEAQ